jgi:hypothetical protein
VQRTVSPSDLCPGFVSRIMPSLLAELTCCHLFQFRSALFPHSRAVDPPSCVFRSPTERVLSETRLLWSAFSPARQIPVCDDYIPVAMGLLGRVRTTGTNVGCQIFCEHNHPTIQPLRTFTLHPTDPATQPSPRPSLCVTGTASFR